MTKYTKWTVFALFVLLLPFGPLALTAKDFVPQQPQRLSKPAMAPAAGEPSTAGEKLFKQLHDQTSRNSTFVAKPYDEARYALYSKIDLADHDGKQGIADAYSGVFFGGVSGVDGCYLECADANGDGVIGFEDYSDGFRQVCENNVFGSRPTGKSSDKCKAGNGDGNGDGVSGASLNIEHICPQMYFNSAPGMVGDLHNLMPTLKNINSSRGTKPFPEVVQILQKSETKGRIARAIFYFLTTYCDRLNPNTAEYFTPYVATLMQWNRSFPPTAFEKQRNSKIESFQGNRNPFVDHPEYVDQIGQQVWQSLFR